MTLEDMAPIGQARAGLFRKLGIERPIDLLFFFPREYVEPAELRAYQDLVADTRSTVVGVVDSIESRSLSDGRSTVGVLIRLDRAGFVRLVWFNQPFRAQNIARGQKVQASGLLKATGVSYEMRHPEVRVLEEDEEFALDRPRPIYPLTDGLKQRHVYQAVKVALETFATSVRESLPDDIRSTYSVLPIEEALRNIHQPQTLAAAESARYRFIFQELLVYQLALAIRRSKMQVQLNAPSIANTAAIHHRILNRIGLTLTGDQQKAIDEICNDMQKSAAMNRLLQGDVGSGKTAVAVYAMLLAVANGYQATLMTPTEILARQHYDRLSKSLTGANCETALLVGSMTGSEKSDVQTKIALGTVDVVIGTQALLSERVEFQKLGLAVIDEQHKFGVAQRAKLRGADMQPHYLVLSATPIPRTLAMTAFGDLDVSTIKEKPPGRAEVNTYVAAPGELISWWKFFLEKIEQGRQGYIISPRVEGDEANEIIGANTIYDQLTKKELQGLRVSLLHGRIDPQTKNETLRKFEQGRIDVLVATTMVEVGIDVANASVMTILDADRLGLAQLHQLRGRVGRGHQAGYVCVFPKTNADEEALEKLKAFVKISDGFELAELDMRLRGPGNLLGTQQTGLPAFRIADILRDREPLELARTAATEIIGSGNGLDAPAYALLKRQVISRHGGMIDFGDVA